jgi:hypothetical protein
MVSLMQLWAPIVLSAVLVFVASSLIHMVVQWHKSEYRGFANEDEVRAAINRHPAPPGKYVVPYCTSAKDMQDPAIVQKFQQGPVGIMLVRAPGMAGMGKQLGSWFVFALLTAFAAGYVASRTLGPGTDYLQVFRVVGTVSFLTYSGGSAIDGIWMGKQWSAVFKDALDGMIYACLSGGAFGWLWPHA